MKKTKWTRKNMSIKTLEGGQIENFKSINAAKKKSRKLQLEEDRGLGRGSLQVIG